MKLNFSMNVTVISYLTGFILKNLSAVENVLGKHLQSLK